MGQTVRTELVGAEVARKSWFRQGVQGPQWGKWDSVHSGQCQGHGFAVHGRQQHNQQTSASSLTLLGPEHWDSAETAGSRAPRARKGKRQGLASRVSQSRNAKG